MYIFEYQAKLCNFSLLEKVYEMGIEKRCDFRLVTSKSNKYIC